MTNILISDLNKSLKSLIGKATMVKADSSAIFIFFNGDSETCESNLYSIENWEILKDEKPILKRGDQINTKETSKIVDGQKLTNIVVGKSSIELTLGNDITIKIHNTGNMRTWEIRLKKDELFFAASGSGEFTKASYKNSQII